MCGDNVPLFSLRTLFGTLTGTGYAIARARAQATKNPALDWGHPDSFSQFLQKSVRWDAIIA